MLATIDTSTYGDAARLLTYANQDAGAVAEALFGALADAALSTGTTSGAAAWAGSYTAVAVSVTDAISSLVSALGNAALLLDVSGHNHGRAEAAAAPYGLPSYALPQRSLCTVAMTGVPPVFGGNADEPGGWSMVVSHLSGYSWPGADLARLAPLAAAWHRAADGLSSLAVLPTSAGEALGMLRSPELPAAISACTRLASIARSLADDCTALGNAVSRFADEIQHQRDPIYDVVKDLATTFAMCEIGGAAASALTGPLGEWGANSYLVARIPRYIARIVALLAGLDETLPVLRPALATTSATDRAWLTMVADTRPVVADIRTSTNVLQSELDAAGATGSGAVSVEGQGEMTEITARRLQGWETSSGSHTISKHVGLSRDELLERISHGRKAASTFPDMQSATRSISAALERNAQELNEWLRGSDPQTTLRATFDDPVGTVVERGGHTRDGYSVRVIVRRDLSDPNGFRIHTAFVDP